MTEAPISCQSCGQPADHGADGNPPLSWVLDRDGDRVSWTCPACALRHVRSMEAKLEPEWW